MEDSQPVKLKVSEGQEIKSPPKILQGPSGSAWVVHGTAVGAGAQGTLFFGHARDNPSQQACFKFFNRSESFSREASALAALSHPAIPRVLDAIASENCLVMEKISGLNLSTAAEKGVLGKLLGMVSIREFCKQLLGVVSHCHSRNVVHRDIKLDNVMINDQGQVYLVDFGLSRTSVSLSGSKSGSPLYAAPEVIYSVSYDGKKADLWACGVVLYVLLYHKFPFVGSNIGDLFHHILADRVDAPPCADMPLRTLMLALLEKNPSLRLSADQAYSMLDRQDASSSSFRQAQPIAKCFVKPSGPAKSALSNSPPVRSMYGSVIKCI